MTNAQAQRRRELIAKAAQLFKEGVAMDYDHGRVACNMADWYLREAKKLGCPRLSDEELGVVRLAENHQMGDI